MLLKLSRLNSPLIEILKVRKWLTRDTTLKMGVSNASYFMEKLFNNQQKIRLSGYGSLHQNGASESTIKKVVTMESTMLIHATIRCTEGTLYTDIWPTAMDYDVWIYKHIPNVQSILSAVDKWSRSRSRFVLVSETLSNCHVWVCPIYVLETKFQKPVVKIPKWDTRSRRGFNMRFIIIHSMQFGLVLNFLTDSISP